MKIAVENLSYAYPGRPVLAGLSFVLHEHSVSALVGPNGSGKSTLLKCLNRIVRADQGRVLVDGVDSGTISRRHWCRQWAYVPQKYDVSDGATVFDTVLLGRRPHIDWQVRPEDEQIVSGILKVMALEALAGRRVNALSGGEQQRVIIARALAQQPAVLLIDEPTNNLDLKHQIELLRLLRRLVRHRALTVLLALHDLNLALRFVDQVLALKDGRVYAAGPARLVLTPETIKAVYDVDVELVTNTGRAHCVVPL